MKKQDVRKEIECPWCDKMATLKEEPRDIIYKGVVCSVQALIYFCKECDQGFTTDDSDKVTMERVYKARGLV